MGETLVRLEGAQEVILDRLTGSGLFKTRSEAIRAGILGLGKEYRVFEGISDIERELAEKKLRKEEAEMKKKGIKYIPEEEALARYR